MFVFSNSHGRVWSGATRGLTPYVSTKLATLSARDGSEGYFMAMDEDYVASHRITVNQRSCECANNNLYACNVLDTPLGSRAWVVQERLFPPRTLNCCKNQLFCVCQARVACEAYPDFLPRGLIREAAHPCLDSEESWRAVVAQYSGCALTKLSDKLVVIFGLAKEYPNIGPTTSISPEFGLKACTLISAGELRSGGHCLRYRNHAYTKLHLGPGQPGISKLRSLRNRAATGPPS